jgi:peptidoglycan L-alanyl-D-glutamate endopeptidase CwlK
MVELMNYFKFGQRSMAELEGVHPTLVVVAHKALRYSPVDFSVTDGVRTMAEQKAYVDSGVSQTMRSKHLIQDDGLGHALDLVPYINGRPRWELEPCYKIAKAVQQAAKEEDLSLRWGGGWCILTQGDLEPSEMVEAYVTRKRKLGKPAFIDAPHYEIAK